MNTAYDSNDLKRNWFDVNAHQARQVGKFSAEGEWLDPHPLPHLRPSLQGLVNSSELVGVECGVGSGINSLNIYNNLDIKKLFLLDLNLPPVEPLSSLIQKDNVSFLQGNSLEQLHNLPDGLDFVYLDASHDFPTLLTEIKIIYPKLKEGGVLGGHDYEQIGVVAAVNTLMLNIWREIGRKPTSFFFESCRDNHPGYPLEYKEIGFPIDWWHIKEEGLGEDFKILPLRNG